MNAKNKFNQLKQKTAGMGRKMGQLPGVGASALFVQRPWVRRSLAVLGGTAGALVAALIVFGTYGWIRRVYAPVAPPPALLVESIQQQQQELAQQQAAVQAEKKAQAADQAEMQRGLDELAQLESRLELALLQREQTVQAVAGQVALVADLTHQVAQQQELAAAKEQELAARKPDTLELNNIKKVAKILSAMKPAALAGVVKQLREDLALEILLRMEERKVAKLFAVLEPDYAARLSTKLNARKTGGRP